MGDLIGTPAGGFAGLGTYGPEMAVQNWSVLAEVRDGRADCCAYIVVAPHVVAGGPDRRVPEGEIGEGDAGVLCHEAGAASRAGRADTVPACAVGDDVGLGVVGERGDIGHGGRRGISRSRGDRRVVLSS